MALDFGKQNKKDFQEEFRVLATQIETINQQLSSGVVGEGGPASAKIFADVGTKLNYLYELLKRMDADVRSDVKASFETVQKSVNATLHKNLGDIYAKQQETTKAITAMEHRMADSPAFNSEGVSDLRRTVTELVNIYKEEVAVFKAQNEFLQKKLIEIEKKLTK